MKTISLGFTARPGLREGSGSSRVLLKTGEGAIKRQLLSPSITARRADWRPGRRRSRLQRGGRRLITGCVRQRVYGLQEQKLGSGYRFRSTKPFWCEVLRRSLKQRFVGDLQSVCLRAVYDAEGGNIPELKARLRHGNKSSSIFLPLPTFTVRETNRNHRKMFTAASLCRAPCLWALMKREYSTGRRLRWLRREKEKSPLRVFLQERLLNKWACQTKLRAAATLKPTGQEIMTAKQELRGRSSSWTPARETARMYNHHINVRLHVSELLSCLNIIVLFRAAVPSVALLTVQSKLRKTIRVTCEKTFESKCENVEDVNRRNRIQRNVNRGGANVLPYMDKRSILLR